MTCGLWSLAARQRSTADTAMPGPSAASCVMFVVHMVCFTSCIASISSSLSLAVVVCCEDGGYEKGPASGYYLLTDLRY